MTSLSIGLALSAAAPGQAGEGPVITASIPPAVQTVRAGDTLADTLPASAFEVESYASSAGPIATVVAEWSVDGGAWGGAGTDILGYGEEISARVTVTDDEGNTRLFHAGTTTVTGLAPALAASDALAGRVLTISVDSLTGTPAPSASLTALTLDGTDVRAAATGTGPWSYAVADSAVPRTLAWQVTATSPAGSATATGSETVPANLAAPAPVTAPALSAAAPAPGDTVTVTEGTYSGTPAPIVSGTLSLDGADVTADMSGMAYTIPGNTADGAALVWDETAANGVGTPETQSASALIEAIFLTIADPGDGTLEITATDQGTIQITVSGTVGYDGIYSVSPADLDAGPVCLMPPAITGTGEIGQPLSKVQCGLWAYAGDGFAVSQCWQADGTDLSGETGESCTPVPALAGATVTIEETATDSGGIRRQDSNAIAVVSGNVFADDFDGYADGADIPAANAAWEYMYQRYGGTMEGTGAGQARLGQGTANYVRIQPAHATAPGADQYARVTFGGWSGSGTIAIGPGVRMTYVSGTQRGDGYHVIAASDGTIKLVKFIGDVQTDIGSPVSLGLAQGDVIEIRATGTTLTVLINGTTLITETDPDLDSGKAGLYAYLASSSAVVLIDNFECGDL